MNPEAQRIAIAEACGWKLIPEYYNGPDSPPEFTTVTPEGNHLCGFFPDYLNDLNAMHEAEKVLREGHSVRWQVYKDYLGVICGMENTPTIHATAAQRAEAFLKTIGKWEGGDQ